MNVSVSVSVSVRVCVCVYVHVCMDDRQTERHTHRPGLEQIPELHAGRLDKRAFVRVAELHVPPPRLNCGLLGENVFAQRRRLCVFHLIAQRRLFKHAQHLAHGGRGGRGRVRVRGRG